MDADQERENGKSLQFFVTPTVHTGPLRGKPGCSYEAEGEAELYAGAFAVVSGRGKAG